MLEGLSFKASYVASLIGNILYIITIYYLWKSIFSYSPRNTINGINFNETIIYLILAASIRNCVEVQVVWEMDNIFQSGKIIMSLIKPVPFHKYLFYVMLGRRIDYFIVIFIPVLIGVAIITNGYFKLGINVVLFLVNFILAIIISYLIDFIVGLIVCYTNSTWGINAMKEIIISFLSGAIIPLQFYPHSIGRLVNILPFKAIYDIPISTLSNMRSDITIWGQELLFQLVWCIVLYFLCIYFWNKSRSAIVINGG